MLTTLITVGISCLLAAIIGGGFKGLGIEIPVVHSQKRQIMLAVAGVVLLGSAVVVKYYKDRPDPNTELTRGLELYDVANFTDALSHLSFAAHHGNQAAEYHYGEMLFHGEGCLPDQKEGIPWVRKAAESGYAPAEASLSLVYYSGGPGVDKDLGQAKVWADRSAAQGDPFGWWQVAILETDTIKKSAALYNSATKGYAPAQYALAMLIFNEMKNSKFSAPDLLGAHSWLEKAAIQDHADAQVYLAVVEFAVAERNWPNISQQDRDKRMPNLEDAYAWIRRALEHQGNRFPLSDRAQAATLREQIEAILPPDAQIRVANSYETWQPKLELRYRHGHE